MKKILVCGSTGFIGRNVAEFFAEKPEFEVYGTHFSRPALTHPKIRPIKANLTDPAQVSEAVKGMNIVIQAAATTSGAKDIVSRPYIHIADNAIMNTLLLRASFDHAVQHFLFFSCSIMYQSSEQPLKESDFNPQTEMSPNYFGGGWNKVFLEKMCEFYSRLGRTKYTAIRHSNIYGPFDKFDLERSHVFGATMTKIMNARDGDRLKVWGPGTEKRDLLYVEDLLEFVEQCLLKKQAPFDLVNVGSGKALSIKDLVQKMIDCSGKNLTMEHDLSQPHIPTQFCLDSSKAKAIFDWSPRTSIDKGIHKTMDWYKRNITTPISEKPS